MGKRSKNKHRAQEHDQAISDTMTAEMELAEQIAQRTSGFIQSENHRELLDIVDTLRSHGVSHYVDLPQIIVCGSQSSGKSSTLEAISGIPFPTSEGLCTRFATELILRRSNGAPEVKVHIKPSPNRSEAERKELAAFTLRSNEMKDFPKIFERAKIAMGLIGEGAKIFSADVLRIESTAPTASNLTLVDLPGLFTAGDKNQSDDDATMVRDLVVGYMKQRRSIILAVISGEYPFANQPVTKFARDIDPTGKRTLGLITKPDKIEKGSENERYFLDLAQNHNVQLKLGWHVLRNKGHATQDDTPEERDKREKDFFRDSIWSDLDAKQLGVETLRERLRKVLWHQIREELPGVKSDVQKGIKDCTTKLRQLGQARTSLREKHTYLQHISSKLSILVRAAIDGVYTDRFFESYPGQDDAFERRLRAHVQKILSKYAEQMRCDGHALEIVEDDRDPVRKSASGYVTREAYLVIVKRLLAECRARELPGMYNPMVVSDLFIRQSKPWEGITQKLVERIHEAATSTFEKMVSDICDKNTSDRLMKHRIQPSLYSLRTQLKKKVDELLEPHLSIHPITYNEYLTETVQKVQEKRHRRKFDGLSQQVCREIADENDTELMKVPLRQVLYNLREGTLTNVEEYSASLAADVAAAYYHVALKKFVDDLSINAIETCLIQQLPEVFSPNVVWDLSDEAVEQLGSEAESTVTDRAELTTKLRILEKGLKDLDAFTARGKAGYSIIAQRFEEEDDEGVVVE